MVSSKLRVTRSTVRQNIHEAPSTQLEFGAGFRAGRETKIVYPRSRNPAGHGDIDRVKGVTNSGLPANVKRTDKKIKARSGKKGTTGISTKGTSKKAPATSPAPKTNKPKRPLSLHRLSSQERRPPLVATKRLHKKRRDRCPRRQMRKPKRPLPAFLVFSRDVRYILSRDNPQMTIPAVGVRIREMWRGMGEEERRPFEERSQRDRSRYWMEMKQWHRARAKGQVWVRPPHIPV